LYLYIKELTDLEKPIQELDKEYVAAPRCEISNQILKSLIEIKDFGLYLAFILPQ
jgi:hypothetical protein